MDINQFRRHLAHLQEAATVIDKIDRTRGTNDSAAWLVIKNSAVTDRSLWLPDADDRAFWSSTELKKVYRFYVNDNPPSHPHHQGSGLVRVDIAAGTVQFIDQDKYVAANQHLTPAVWARPLKIDTVTVFKREFLDNQ